jgi:hypothetical protein
MSAHGKFKFHDSLSRDAKKMIITFIHLFAIAIAINFTLTKRSAEIHNTSLGI